MQHRMRPKEAFNILAAQPDASSVKIACGAHCSLSCIIVTFGCTQLALTCNRQHRHSLSNMSHVTALRAACRKCSCSVGPAEFLLLPAAAQHSGPAALLVLFIQPLELLLRHIRCVHEDTGIGMTKHSAHASLLFAVQSPTQLLLRHKSCVFWQQALPSILVLL